MSPIYTPPKQDEAKERALADAIKRREEGKLTEKLMKDQGYIELQKEKK